LKDREYSNSPKVSDSETIIFLGSYDRGKPRVQLLLEGASKFGLVIQEVHVDIWHKVKDKSQIQGTLTLFLYVLKWVIYRPLLLYRYCRAPAHHLVVMPYPGVFDLLVLYPAIRCRGAKIFLDAFISPYDTVVNDRRLTKSNSLLAKVLYSFEWVAVHIADVVFLDTECHSNYFRLLFRLPKERSHYVPVGVETSVFQRELYDPWDGESPLRVLFYGQFVPLQGTLTLLEAISSWERSSKSSVQWTIIGEGQDSAEFDRKLARLDLKSVRRVCWVPYCELPNWIQKSDICCGIFGSSQKALNVIPNKIYQALAVGRPILTTDTPGIRSLLEPGPAIELVRPNDPSAIVTGLFNLSNRLLERPEDIKASVAQMPIIGPQVVGAQLASVLRESSDSN